jgi:uncharacterized protein
MRCTAAWLKKLEVEFEARRPFGTLALVCMRPPLSVTPSPTFVHTEIQPGIWLDSRLAVWFSAERLLVIADLHWGYVASHRARGNLLPWWGDDEIEARLRSLIETYQPAEMLWLGDVVHAAEGGARAEAFVRDARVPITLVAGNHDRRWRPVLRNGAMTPTPASPLRSVARGKYFFHHGDVALSVPDGSIEVVGHHHPAIGWWDGAGGNVKLPALIASPRRLVLPAFSPWAAGTPWMRTDADVESLWAIAPSRIFPVPRRAGVAR